MYRKLYKQSQSNQAGSHIFTSLIEVESVRLEQHWCTGEYPDRPCMALQNYILSCVLVLRFRRQPPDIHQFINVVQYQKWINAAFHFHFAYEGNDTIFYRISNCWNSNVLYFANYRKRTRTVRTRWWISVPCGNVGSKASKSDADATAVAHWALAEFLVYLNSNI